MRDDVHAHPPIFAVIEVCACGALRATNNTNGIANVGAWTLTRVRDAAKRAAL